VGIILLAELVLILGGWIMAPQSAHTATAPIPTDLTNTHAFWRILYTVYLYLFDAAGMVLLIAMIGAIVLTHRRRTGVRKQVIADQIARRPEDTIEMRKVESGKGI